MSRLFDFILKREKKQVFHDNGGTITVREKEWVEKGAAEYESVFKRPQTDSVKTNIQVNKMYSLTSQAKDWFLELQLRSGKYMFNNMLAVVNPFGEAPLTALVLFTTMVDYRVRATVEGDSEDTSFIFEYPAEKRHRIPILGLYPGRSTNIVIELLDENGESCDRRCFPIETEPLPDDLQNVIKAGKSNKKNRNFPNILISGGSDIRPCVFDREGKIRYYLERKPKEYGIFRLSKGRFLFMEEDISVPFYSEPYPVQMYDMDYLGRVGRTYLIKNGAHHTAEERSQEGNLFMAGNSFEGDSEDLVMEVDRQSGEIVHGINVRDFFGEKYKDSQSWAHINYVSYQEERASMLVSMRGGHSIADFDWERDEMKWLLADPDLWKGTETEDKLLTPIGNVPWFYGQNSVFEVELEEKQEPGIRYIVVFDNHWKRPHNVSGPDNGKKSYINVYEIDEGKRTVKLYRTFPCPKSKICSNAVFDKKNRLLYAMEGCLEPRLKDNLGLVRAFDFDSREVLGEYYVKTGFYRAYLFCPDMVSLSRALVKNNDYIVGGLRRPERLEGEDVCPPDFMSAHSVADSVVSYEMQEDILYICEGDHAINTVYFQGREGVWFVTFEDTYRTSDNFGHKAYSIAVWLDVLPADSYDLFIQIGDELQDTGKKITKQK